jgi:hypothetical protein
MKRPGIISALIYFGISIVAGVLFFVGSLAGNYSIVERVGGSIWVFILATIILMPIVIPRIKKRFTG